MRQIIDKHYDNDEFKFEFAEGSNATLLVDVQSLGSADTDLSGYTAKLYYYDSVRDTSSYQITSDSLDAATGRFTFDIQPSDLAEYGAYLAELVIIDGSDNEFLQCFGNVIIKESILDAGTTAATTGPVLNYTVFSSFSGTKTSGPYTAGTNVTFSDPDSNGRVAINSSGGGGGATDLDDLTDVTITTPITDLQVLIYDGGEWVNGWPEVKMIQVRNDEGSTIPAGAPLYSKGEIGGSNRILVGIADASDSAKMPCIGIAYAEMNTSSTQDNYGVVGGVYNTDLNGGFTGLSEGDTVYVKNWTGTPTSASDVLTTTRPTDGGVEVQNVGVILKTNGTTIQGLLVSAIGRSNDIPNAIVTTNSADADYVYIDDGNVWKKITPSNLGISGNSLPFGTWDYDSDLGTPDAGQFSTNNATASAVTQIKIHDNNSDGVDVSGITDLFNAGDYLYIQESGDASTSHLYLIDSRGFSFTGGQSFNVTHQSLSSNSTWTNGNACGIFYIHASETNDYLLNRANHTGTQTASTISDFDTEVSNNTDVTANTAKVSADGSVTTHNDVTDAGSGAIITSDERTKLSGIEAGAEVNPTDAEIETAYNNQVAVMSEAEAHAGTSNDVRRLTAYLVRHNVDSSQAAITAITLTIDGGGSAITAGALGKFPTVPYSGEIESVEVAADQSGSIVIDIWKAADAIPSDTNSITGSSPATLSSAQRSQDETLTGWTTSISAGDVLGFEVDSVSTVQEVTLTIKVKKGS